MTKLAAGILRYGYVTGLTITSTEGDLTEWPVVERVFKDFATDTIIHYGQIPAAPYSMMDRHRSVFTQYNNVISTLNVLWAMHDMAPDAHLVKLGTMGEYGTPNIDIEEGWIEIAHNGRSDRLPFPKLPGSLYLQSMFGEIERHQDRVITEHIMPSITWRTGAAKAAPKQPELVHG